MADTLILVLLFGGFFICIILGDGTASSMVALVSFCSVLFISVVSVVHDAATSHERSTYEDYFVSSAGNTVQDAQTFNFDRYLAIRDYQDYQFVVDDDGSDGSKSMRLDLKVDDRTITLGTWVETETPEDDFASVQDGSDAGVGASEDGSLSNSDMSTSANSSHTTLRCYSAFGEMSEVAQPSRMTEAADCLSNSCIYDVDHIFYVAQPTFDAFIEIVDDGIITEEELQNLAAMTSD